MGHVTCVKCVKFSFESNWCWLWKWSICPTILNFSNPGPCFEFVAHKTEKINIVCMYKTLKMSVLRKRESWKRRAAAVGARGLSAGSRSQCSTPAKSFPSPVNPRLSGLLISIPFPSLSTTMTTVTQFSSCFCVFQICLLWVKQFWRNPKSSVCVLPSLVHNVTETVHTLCEFCLDEPIHCMCVVQNVHQMWHCNGIETERVSFQRRKLTRWSTGRTEGISCPDLSRATENFLRRRAWLAVTLSVQPVPNTRSMGAVNNSSSWPTRSWNGASSGPLAVKENPANMFTQPSTACKFPLNYFSCISIPKFFTVSIQ